MEATDPSAAAVRAPGAVRFGVFEVDPRSGEVRKSGLKVKLTGQPFRVLAMLLERPGEMVTREELQKRLWPADTFVDFDHSLNTAINKIRDVLGDSAQSPRFVETLPRRGYRFIAPVETIGAAGAGLAPPGAAQDAERKGVATVSLHGTPVRSRFTFWIARLASTIVVVAVLYTVYQKLKPHPPTQRALTRLTFDAGLQFGATWSPDGRFIAYSSDRGGKFDIWVQPVAGGDAVQITHGPGANWQPDWSSDGQLIAFRSEGGDGGLYAVPALGGPGRKIASFGYHPHWSPDGSEVLFQTSFMSGGVGSRFYVVRLDGSPAREILTELPGRFWFELKAAIWQPDGKRVSVWATAAGWSSASLSFWTAPVAGGPAAKSEIAPDVVKQLEEVAVGGAPGFISAVDSDPSFSWAPSGKAIFFERTLRGARNLWKLSMDSGTLRGVAVERLTAGSGPDTDLALSPDGTRLAFTSRTQHTRTWLFPFDASSGRITGNGEAAISPGMEAWAPDLSRDGRKLAFLAERGGRWELWEQSLLNEREALVVSGAYVPFSWVRWSRDGTRLAYDCTNSKGDEHQFVVWSAEHHNEEVLTSSTVEPGLVYDWSPDDKSILVTRSTGKGPRREHVDKGEIWMLPLAAAPHAETDARRLVSDPAYGLYQGRFSPDGRWIVFEAVRSRPHVYESTLYVVPASGGAWVRITDGKDWADKPRWSPDGKTIYFLSGDSGFFNVWGIRFNPVRGRPLGEPFRVTSFESPSLMVPQQVSAVELSLTQDRLALTMQDISGSIWMLDHVDR